MEQDLLVAVPVLLIVLSVVAAMGVVGILIDRSADRDNRS